MNLETPCARRAGARREFDGAHHAEVAHVDDLVMVRERMEEVCKRLFERQRLLENPFFIVHVHRGEAGGRRDRVARVGVAVEQLDHVVGALHDRVMDLLLHEHRAHRDDAVGQTLGRRDDVGRHAESLGAESFADPAEGRDDLIEDQQDAVCIADLPQPLEIADRRRQDTGRARDRLDDDGRDVAAVVQHAQALEILGQFRAMLGQTAAEGVAPDVQRVPQVIDARQQRRAEDFAVRHDAAHRHAAEVHAVITLLATDQSRAVTFAFGAMVGEGDLECRVDRLRSGVREEHIRESIGCHVDDALGQCKRLVVAHLEGNRVVERGDLLLHGLDDLRVAMADAARPQARKRVVDAPAVTGRVVVAIGANDDTRRFLEVAIGRERHPQGIGGDGIHRCKLRRLSVNPTSVRPIRYVKQSVM